MADWFSNIFASLTSSVQEFTGEAVQSQIALFRTFLNGGKNPVVRFWVEAGASYGHQSSTANLIYRLAKPIDPDGLCFGYGGIIQIYYENAGELVKLKELIPELNLGTPKINNATLTAILYTAKPANPPIHL